MKVCPAWEKHVANVRSANRIPKSANPWTSRRGIQLRGVPATLRVRQSLDTVWAVAMAQANHKIPAEKLRENLWVDLSQDIVRMPLTPAKRSRGFPVITTSSIIYSFQEDVTLSGRSNFLLLGHPPSRTSRQAFSEAKLRDLAGEGFSVPYCALISFIMYSNPHGPWWA